jgi:hypothetical protein
MRLKVLTRTSFLLPFLIFQSVSAYSATITFNSSLTGANETPPETTAGTGTGTFVFDTVALNITYSLSYSGLSTPATMAHIHFGAAGVAGPVILPFTPSPTGTSGVISGVLTTADLINQASSGIVSFTDIYNAALAGNLYSNVHTITFPAGEIRGQLAQASAVPEPATGLLFAAGLLAVPLVLRLRHS